MMAMALEEEFNIDIPDDVEKHITTGQAAIKYIEYNAY